MFFIGIKFINIAIANTHSTLLSALKTNLPIPSPNGSVMPGALNLSQPSIKLIAQTNPIQRNVIIRAIGILTVVIIMVLTGCFYNIQFWSETSPPFAVPATWLFLLLHQ